MSRKGKAGQHSAGRHLRPDDRFVALYVVVALRGGFREAIGIQAALENGVQDIELMLA
jgi:hypothetical protein